MSEPDVFVIKPVGKEFANNENYELINLFRRADVSEPKPDPTSDDGSSGTKSTDPALAALAALAPPEPGPRDMKLREKLRDLRAQLAASREPPFSPLSVHSPKLAPELGSSAVANETSKEAAKEAPKERPKEARKIEAVKTEPMRLPGAKLPTTSSARGDDPCDEASEDAYDGSWVDETADTSSEQDSPATAITGKRRIAAVAAVIGLAVVSGAIGGALATARFGHHAAPLGDQASTANIDNQAIEESIARIDAELGSLKQLSVAQSTKLNERIDKIEKAQAEPAAKLARLSETIEKLRAAPAAFASATPKETAAPRETAAATPLSAPASIAPAAAPQDTTGSIQPPAAAKPKPEVARLPALQGWVLRNVSNDGAVIEGRQGMFEVVAGDAMPGLGRVEAIKRQDGRWVVVTTKGLIVGR